MVTEAHISQVLDQALQAYAIQTQVILQDQLIYIMLNRAGENIEDFTPLIQLILEHLSHLPVPNVPIHLQSRVLGEVDPDWEQVVSWPEQSNSSLTEDDIRDYLDQVLSEYRIRTQISTKDHQLKVMLNRPGDVALDYGWVVQALQDAIQSLRLPDITTLNLQCRVFGERKADWKQLIDLENLPNRIPEPSLVDNININPPVALAAEKAPEDPTPQLEVTDQQPDPVMESTAVPEPELTLESVASDQTDVIPDDTTHDDPDAPRDISSYCFVRNKTLVTTELPHPSQEVAAAVLWFHELSEAEKYQLLPVLDQFFKNPDIPLPDLPETLQAWFQSVEPLNERELKSVAVWLSRYCADQERAMTQVQTTMDKLADIEAFKVKAAAEEAKASPSVVPVAPPQPEPPPSQPGWKQFVIPAAAFIGLVLVAVIGVSLVSTPPETADVCQAPDTPFELAEFEDYCRLATEIMGGADPLAAAAVGAESLSEPVVSTLGTFCLGQSTDRAFDILTTETAEIAPGLYTVYLDFLQVEGQSTNLASAACVIRGVEDKPILLSSTTDLPFGWPAEQGDLMPGIFAFGVVGVLINVILKLLSTSIGLFINTRLGFGLRIYTFADFGLSVLTLTFWRVAFEILRAFIPVPFFLRIAVALVFEVIALSLTAQLIKSIEVDSAGLVSAVAILWLVDFSLGWFIGLYLLTAVFS